MDKMNWSKILNIETVFDITRNYEVIEDKTNSRISDWISNGESFSHFFNLVLPNYKVMNFTMSPFSEHIKFKSQTFKERDRENILLEYDDKVQHITLDDLEETVFKQPFADKELFLPRNLLLKYIVKWLKFDISMYDYSEELMLKEMELKIKNIMAKEI